MPRRVDPERMRRHLRGGLLDPKKLRELPPGEKIRIVEAMGFVAQGEDPGSGHAGDCPYLVTQGSYVCNCVPDPTVWYPPNDVLAHRHETYEERLAAKQRWYARMEAAGRM